MASNKFKTKKFGPWQFWDEFIPLFLDKFDEIDFWNHLEFVEDVKPHQIYTIRHVTNLNVQ